MTNLLRDRAARIIAPKPFRRLDGGKPPRMSDEAKIATAYRRADRLIDLIYRDAVRVTAEALQAKAGGQAAWPLA